VEVEANLDARHVFANVAWTRIDGEARDGRGGVSSLYTVPGDTLSLTLGGRALEGRVDAGVRYRHVGPRAFPVGVAPVGGLPPLGTQPGFELVDLFVGMRPSPGFELRFGVENATNESYFLTGFGGGQGAQAPGRGYRVTGTLQF
jgi:hemoglobin/transferrin/lactoferrin receptor protein